MLERDEITPDPYPKPGPNLKHRLMIPFEKILKQFEELPEAIKNNHTGKLYFGAFKGRVLGSKNPGNHKILLKLKIAQIIPKLIININSGINWPIFSDILWFLGFFELRILSLYLLLILC